MALVLAVPLALTALLCAAAVTPRPLPAFALAAWVFAVTEVVAVALVLSPFHAVDRVGYAAAELILLGIAAAIWVRAGKPRPVVPARPSFGDHPILFALGAAVLLALGYELVLSLTVWPNNWDSLTYHLSRAAAWYQHEEVGWIDSAPTERQNAFPANSELALLWSFVAVRSDRLAGAWQFAAQLAVLVATYGIAVRVGFRRSSALFAALLLATFALVALESTTTQNDLFLASTIGACAYFLLGGTTREGVLAGLAFALALGTKLTAVLALPVLLLLVLVVRPPKRTILFAVASAVVSFAVLDGWLYVQNVDETGHLLGHGGGRVEHSPALTLVGWLATVLRVLYRFFDFSGAEGVGPGYVVAVATLVAAAALAALLAHREGASIPMAVAITLAWPIVVLGGAALLRVLLQATHFPIAPSGTSEGSFAWRPSTRDNEDFSYFGPLGVLLLVVAAAMLTRHTWRERPARVVLAAAVPLFLAGLAAAYRFNDFIGRFMLVPVVLAAALLAVLYERRVLAAGVAALAIASLGLVLVNNELKPMLKSPWSMSLARTLDLQTWQLGIGGGVDALAARVPADACIGAVLGGDDASYPLFGPHLRRRVSYVTAPAGDAVIIGPGESSLQPGAGWQVSSLAGYWRLAVRSGVREPFAC